jgi:HPt (histidine-containing phosphotransfer) domain-containing protein
MRDGGDVDCEAIRRDAARPVAGDGRPLDFAHLDRMTFGSRDLQHEVLGMFLAQSQALLDRIRSAVDVDSGRRAAHTLKGSARGIGAFRVARLAEAVEMAEQVPGAAAHLFGELTAAVEAVDRVIRQELGNRA